MTPLVIDDVAQEAIRQCAAYAEAHPLTMRDISKAQQTGLRIGDDPHFRVDIPMGFIACYSIEEQPIGRCRHQSISVIHQGRVVNTEAAWMLAAEFGFWGKLCDVSVIPWFEDLPDGRQALNLMQLHERPIERTAE